MNLTIYGQSDDNFELRGYINEEIDAYGSRCAVEVTVGGVGIRVTMHAGEWRAGFVHLILPSQIKYTVTSTPRTDRVEIDVPDGALVRVLIDDEIALDTRVGMKALTGWERKAVNAGWLPVNTASEGSVEEP